jgi:hypothetical protein
MEESETWRTMLRMMVDAVAMLRAKLDDIERHIEGLERGALNAAEDLIADGKSRLAAMKSHAPPVRVLSSHGTTRRQATTAKTASGSAVPADCGFDDLGGAAEQSQRYALATLQRVSKCIDEAETAVVRAVLIGMEADALGPEQDGEARLRSSDPHVRNSEKPDDACVSSSQCRAAIPSCSAA